MSENNNNSNEEAALLARLEKLEAQIKGHDETQVKLRYISLGGIFLILFFFITFVYRIIDYARTYEYKGLAQDIVADSVSIVRPEVEMFLGEIRTNLLPNLSEKLTNEFQQRTPEIKDVFADLGDSLAKEVRKRAEQRVLETMITSLENSSEEIRNIFPEFTPEDLEKQIEAYEQFNEFKKEKGIN